MTLKELSAEYRQSGAACRARAAELRRRLEEERMGETQRLRLRRRVCVLASMARDAAATANYLEHYYERREVYERRQPMGREDGVSGSAAVYQAGRFL